MFIIKEIFLQLYKDLIGKDSHRGVTITYSWLANQFGHFAIGYILTLIIFVSYRKERPIN
jgi:hypothetical protein